jgi:hypothetical protein
MNQFIQSHTDGIVASSTGTVVSAATVLASPVPLNDLLSVLLPILTGILSGFVALGFKAILSVIYSRREQKKILLLEQAKKLREDEDVSNDTHADAKELEAKLIEAELRAISKVIDKQI